MAIAAALTLSSCGGAAPMPQPPARPGHLPRSSSLPPDPLATGTRVALGVNADGPPVTALERFTELAGAPPKIAMWFEDWDEPLLYPVDVQAAASVGAIPMLTWDPVSGGHGIPLGQIAEGADDAYIRLAAEAAAGYRQRLYIRFAHEMNLPGSAFGPGRDGNTPQTFIAAWRHVVTIFRKLAPNVEFVWSPNVYCEGHCPFTAFYPGDAWVDWVALDGYNYGPTAGDPWLTFGEIFGPSYAIITQLTGKPLMIGETASTEVGGSKPKWIIGMGQALATRFPRVRAVVWFDRLKETDWRINSSAASLAAFRRVVTSPPFGG